MYCSAYGKEDEAENKLETTRNNPFCLYVFESPDFKKP